MINKILFALIAFLTLTTPMVRSQSSIILDEIKLENYTINAVFYDPYINLIEQNPSFSELDSIKQSEIWENYILNNVIFDFQLTRKEKIIKHYIIRGNPSETIEKLNLPRNTIYQLDIVRHMENLNYYNTPEYEPEVVLTVNKLEFYGTLFESMKLIQDEINNGQRKIAYDFFGRHRLPIQYNTIMVSVLAIFADDIYGQIPSYMIEKDEMRFNNPFFNYQQCLDEYFQIDRIEKIYIRRYNKDGSIQDEFPRVEITEDIKSTLNDTTGILKVMALPCFGPSDSAIHLKATDSTNVFCIKTNNNRAIDKYLNDIVVTKNIDNEITKIEATRLIHASSINGDYIIKENYIAYFKRFDKCILPYLILTSASEDTSFTKPNSVIELDYLFYRK